jgi:lambda family phage tail tape measure protein
MATNLNYNVNVNSTAGVQALNNLQNKVDGVNRAFDGLRSAIAGIAITQVLSNIIRFADGIKDISDATGVATTEILGFQRAVTLFGGSAEAADKGLLRLVGNIGEAADGSASLQGAFAKVGVTLNDLATLSERDILIKVIQGLEGIDDKSTQAALKTQLLGKEFRAISTSGLSDAFAKNTAESQKYAQAIERAAQLQENLDRSLETVKLTLLELISPAMDFINALNPQRLAEIVEGFTRLAAAMTVLYGFGRIVAIVEALAVGLSGAAGAAALFGINILKNFTLIGKVLTGVGALVLGFKTLFPDAAKSITESFGKAVDAAKDFFGIEKPKFLDQAEVDRENKLLAQRSEELKKNGEIVRQVKDPFDQLRKSLGSVAEEYARMNKLSIEQINLQSSLIGKSREEAEVSKAKADLLRKEAEEIEKLNDKRSKLSKEQVDGGLGKVIDEQIAKIKEQTKVDLEGTESAIRNSQLRIRAFDLEKFARQSQIDVEKQIRDIQFEMATSTMSEMEKKAANIRRDAWERANAEIKAQEAARGTLMVEEEKQKYYDEALRKTDDLIQANEELYNKSREFSTGWKNAFRDYIDNATNAARRAEQIFRKTTQGMEDLIVGFVKTGKFEWKNFVSMMLEELLRAQIQQIFAQMLGGMKDTIGGGGGGIMGAIGGLFGGGGGGSSGGGGGGIMDAIGGLFGGGGGGLGASQNNPMYVVDVGGGGGMGGGFGGFNSGTEGEGGGMFGSIGRTLSGVWDGIKSTAGKVWDGIKSVGGSVIDTISSVAGGAWEGIKKVGGAVWDGIKSVGGSVASGIGSVVSGISSVFGGGGGGGGGSFLGDIASGIGDFFGGFFANGGNPGIGKPILVGERGPELMIPRNASTIVPNSALGGSSQTQITYNIQAVDASSFRSMVARDPEFIYNVTEQGRKGLPNAGRRR